MCLSATDVHLKPICFVSSASSIIASAPAAVTPDQSAVSLVSSRTAPLSSFSLVISNLPIVMDSASTSSATIAHVLPSMDAETEPSVAVPKFRLPSASIVNAAVSFL